MLLKDKLSYGAISYSFPEEIVTLDDWAYMTSQRSDFVSMVKQKYKVSNFRRSENKTPRDMAIDAVDKLFSSNDIDPKTIDAIIHYHTLATSVPPSWQSLPCDIAVHLNIKDALCFSLAQQNCVSSLAAVQIFDQISKFDPNVRKALLIGSDRVLDEGTRNLDGMQMESDGAAATILERGNEYNIILDYSLRTSGEHFRGPSMMSTTNVTSDRMFFLLFSRLLKNLIDRNSGVDASKIRAVFPHNVNPDGVAQVLDHVGISKKFLYTDNVPKNGHNFGNDVLINLSDAVSQQFANPGDYAIQLASGFGRTYGAALIKL